MNEYLTTAVAAEHRRELLEEAQANGLARIAREGQPSLRSRLGAALAGLVRRRRTRGHAATHRLAH
jgi:hypothetical protein